MKIVKNLNKVETAPLSEGGYIEIPGGPAGAVLPPNFSWLRCADAAMQANYGPLGAVEKLVRTWDGGPLGLWAPDIYPSA